MLEQAIAKIDSEVLSFKGGNIENCMKDRCAEVLKSFCTQDEEFAQAVVQNSKTFSECIKSIADKYTKTAKQNGISDFEAFKTMVEFYFSGAVIQVHMTIDLIGSTETPQSQTIEKPKSKIIDLTDFM